MTETLHPPTDGANGEGQVGLDEVAAMLRGVDKVLVATHLNPDGDAVGSARAMQLVMQRLGADVQVYIPGALVPREYRFIAPEVVLDAAPDDIDERVLVCVDCGNEGRVQSTDILERARYVIDIDHHGDNTRFGDMNHIRADAACAAELVWELAGEFGIDEPGPDIATAVYVGLVTDTGRFQYSNTTADSFDLAARLVREGVDVHDVFSRVFERVEFTRTKLLGRALERSIRSTDGSVVATHLRREDFVEIGASEDDAEGIVDALRSVEGTRVAVFLRDLDAGGAHARKGSLRATGDDVDVSAIARTWSGGGHRQAAGFNTDDDLETVVGRVEQTLRGQ